MKRLFFLLLIVLINTGFAKDNNNHKIVQFLDDFYGAFEIARIDGDPYDQHYVDSFFADDCEMYFTSFYVYNQELDESPYYQDPPDCGLPGISCGPEILTEIIVPFLTAYPGMDHDVKQTIYKQLGGNVWQIWAFYDYKAPKLDVNGEPTDGVRINFPGVSIYTVDMKLRRPDGQKGQVIRGKIIIDNYKFMCQSGAIDCGN
jgi:hypothetical protein